MGKSKLLDRTVDVSALKGNLQNSTHKITGNCEDFIVGIPFKSVDLLHLTFLPDIQVQYVPMSE